MSAHPNFELFRAGFRDGLPIGAGYFAVAFSLGIAARGVGLSPGQGFLASLLTIASAGEHAGFSVIGTGGSYPEMALVILVANCRYLLMSFALSQRLDPKMRYGHRLGMGAFITDEIFAVSIAREGYLNPLFTYGAAAASVLPWAVGTALGISLGNLLPDFIVTALGVALYGMFVAIIVPPARKSKPVAGLILVSFAASFALDRIPLFDFLSDGIKIVVLTVTLSGLAAWLFPVKDEKTGSGVS